MSSDQAIKRMMYRIIGFPMASVSGWEALARSAYMVIIWLPLGLPWVGMITGSAWMLGWAWYNRPPSAAEMAAGERDLDDDGPEWLDLEEETRPDNR